jgi:hypothetical protein
MPLKRRMKKLIGPCTKAKPAETRPQLTMMRAIQRRAPTRSRMRLEGTSSAEVQEQEYEADQHLKSTAI